MKRNITNLPKSAILGLLIFLGLAAFDVFNFATTRDALSSIITATLLNIPLSWPLAVAFCAIDLGGIASVFTKEKGFREPWYVWMLGAGWIIASIANSGLTFMAIRMGMASAPIMHNPLIPADIAIKWVPILLASVIWLIRVMIIGSIIVADNHKEPVVAKPAQPAFRMAGSSRPMPKPNPQPVRPMVAVPGPQNPKELERLFGSDDD
jgi:hypothetical protein